MATLHTSPMPKDAYSGQLVYDKSEVATRSGLTSPDLAWLRFVERVSPAEALGNTKTSGFSAGAFVHIYEDHRTKYESASGLRVRRG
jgi:hypothetical protein